MKVAVVGAGVLGASLAAALQARGATVTLVDASAPGSGTSSRGAGLVCEGMWHPTSLKLVLRSMELLTELSRASEKHGHAFRYHTVGSTTLVPERMAESARRMAAFQRREGATVKEVAPADVASLPRHAGIDASGAAFALHYPRDGWASPREYAETRAADVRVVRGTASLARHSGRTSLRVDGRDLVADQVALACGVHTRALLRGAGLDAPLLAYRTQAARVEHPRAHEVPLLHDEVNGFYLRPGAPGQLVAGNGTTTTPEDVDDWRATPDDDFAARQLARVRARFPFLATASCDDAWAGIDAATPDRLLLAGVHPAAGDVWLLAGGNGMGFMRAPAVGESLAAQMLGEKPRIDISAFDPGRFAADMSRDFVIHEGYSLE